jgi:hypothetical protein
MIAPYVALLDPPMRRIGSERQISARVCPRAALDDPRARDDDDEDDDDDEKEVCATADGDRATLDDSRERLCTARAFVCAPKDAFEPPFEPVSPAGAARKIIWIHRWMRCDDPR